MYKYKDHYQPFGSVNQLTQGIYLKHVLNILSISHQIVIPYNHPMSILISIPISILIANQYLFQIFCQHRYLYHINALSNIYSITRIQHSTDIQSFTIYIHTKSQQYSHQILMNIHTKYFHHIHIMHMYLNRWSIDKRSCFKYRCGFNASAIIFGLYNILVSLTNRFELVGLHAGSVLCLVGFGIQSTFQTESSIHFWYTSPDMHRCSFRKLSGFSNHVTLSWWPWL